MAYKPYLRDGWILLAGGVVILIVSAVLKSQLDSGDPFILLYIACRAIGLVFLLAGAYFLQRARGHDPNAWTSQAGGDRYVHGLVPPESQEAGGCSAEEFLRRYYPTPPARREAALRCLQFFEQAAFARTLPHLHPNHRIREDLQYQTNVASAEKAAFLSTCLHIDVAERDLRMAVTFDDLVEIVRARLEGSGSRG